MRMRKALEVRKFAVAIEQTESVGLLLLVVHLQCKVTGRRACCVIVASRAPCNPCHAQDRGRWEPSCPLLPKFAVTALGAVYYDVQPCACPLPVGHPHTFRPNYGLRITAQGVPRCPLSSTGNRGKHKVQEQGGCTLTPTRCPEPHYVVVGDASLASAELCTACSRTTSPSSLCCFESTHWLRARR